MDDQNFTITFPFDERTGWVLVFLMTLIIGSAAIYAVTSNRNPISKSSEDWRMKALGVALIPLAPIWAMLLGLVLWALLKMGTRLPTVGDDADALRWGIIGFVGLLTALAGLLGTPLALLRINATERQTRTAEQSHITDQISKAVEQLGTNREVVKIDDEAKRNTETAPNIEVRIGGLLALERIKNSSPDDHIQIMEIFCAYVRENMRQIVAGIKDTEGEQPHQLREDIKTTFSIISRRSSLQRNIEKNWGNSSKESYRPDFSKTTFYFHDMREIDFENTILDGTVFNSANCSHVSFEKAEMYNTSFSSADLFKANFCSSTTINANFNNAYLGGAAFINSNCQHADFIGCDLTRAIFLRTDLQYCRVNPENPMSLITIHQSNIADAELSQSITQSQVDDCFGDDGTHLPNALQMPAHWPVDTIFDPTEEWQYWLNCIDSSKPYIPPQDRA